MYTFLKIMIYGNPRWLAHIPLFHSGSSNNYMYLFSGYKSLGLTSHQNRMDYILVVAYISRLLGSLLYPLMLNILYSTL